MNDWYEAEQRVEKARELFEQCKWSEALEELRAAIAINPYNSGWHFNLGLTLDEMDRYEEAADAYRQALSIDEGDLQAMTHLGVDLCRMGQYQEALKIFEGIEARDPAFEASYCNRILVYSELGDHDKAEEMFYLARLYKEQCPQCFYAIGCSLSARKEYDRAIFCFLRTLDLDADHPDVHVRIAEARWKKGELEQARRDYLTALRKDPGDTIIMLDLGRLLSDMGRQEEAGEKYRRAIELKPDDPTSYYCMGCWLMRSRRDEEAWRAFEKVLELDPTFSGAHLRLAQLSRRQRNSTGLQTHLRAELLLRPDDAFVLRDLADLLLDISDARAAISCLRRLVQIEPENVKGWQNLGVAQFLVGRYADGIASCRQATRRDPSNTAVMHNIALAFCHQKQYARALIWTRRGLALTPHDRSLQTLHLRLKIRRLLKQMRRWLGR